MVVGGINPGGHVPWDVNDMLMIQRPPEGLPGFGGAESVAAALTISGSIASGADWAAWLEFGGRNMGVTIHDPVRITGGIASTPKAEVADKEAAVTGSATAQTGTEQPAKPTSLWDRVVGAGKRIVSTVNNWVHNAGAAVASAAKKFGHAVARGARKAWNLLGRVSASPLTRVTCAVVGIAALLVQGGIALVGGLAAGAGAAAIAIALCGAAAEAAGLAGLAGWTAGAIDVATGGGANETLGDMIGPRGMAVVDSINLGVGLAGLAGNIATSIIKFVAGRAALGAAGAGVAGKTWLDHGVVKWTDKLPSKVKIPNMRLLESR